ncbi:MAG: hypothetical protein LBD03_03675 [Methanobrevibacter sp.]|jgi:KEOPS complex subunit Pcc1|nr:hypothetical protein [Candidatus Methanovirga procula]
MTENCSNIINFVKGKIFIDFDSEKDADIVYNAVYLEIEATPDYRSKACIEVEGQTLTIFIDSKDMTSFRASINSIIKWIKLSYEMINTIENS